MLDSLRILAIRFRRCAIRGASIALHLLLSRLCDCRRSLVWVWGFCATVVRRGVFRSFLGLVLVLFLLRVDGLILRLINVFDELIKIFLVNLLINTLAFTLSTVWSPVRHSIRKFFGLAAAPLIVLRRFASLRPSGLMRRISPVLDIMLGEQMVLGYALAMALRWVGNRLLVLLKLVAVIISILTNSMLLMKLLLIDLRGALLLCTLLRLKLSLFLLTLLLETHLLNCILIQVFVQVLLPFERLVRVTNELGILLNFSDLLQVLL